LNTATKSTLTISNEMTNPAHLSGPLHPDNLILTRNFSPTKWDFAKTQIRIFLIGFSFAFFACNRFSQSDKYSQNLPDNDLINEVFLSVIRIDSFRYDYSLSKEISIPKLYKFGMLDLDTISPFTHISFDELYICFSSDSTKSRIEDSLFIKRQLDVAKKYFITDKVKSRFNKDSKKYYLFDLPIFNYKKNTVELKYRDYYTDSDYVFHQEVLVKENSRWLDKKFPTPTYFE
jgi:hypothetical protein